MEAVALAPALTAQRLINWRGSLEAFRLRKAHTNQYKVVPVFFPWSLNIAMNLSAPSLSPETMELLPHPRNFSLYPTPKCLTKKGFDFFGSSEAQSPRFDSSDHQPRPISAHSSSFSLLEKKGGRFLTCRNSSDDRCNEVSRCLSRFLEIPYF